MRTNSTSQVQQKNLRSPFLRFYSIVVLSLILCGSTYAQTSVTAGTTTTGYTLNSAATYVDAAIVVISASNITGFKNAEGEWF